MTATAHATPDKISPLAQVAALSARAVKGFIRQPTVWVPGMIFPLLIAAVNGSALGNVTENPAFPPVDSFYDFLLPATMIQGVMFGSIAAASDLALDVENGFFDRLIASPVFRPSILIGRLAGGAVLAAAQAVVFTGVFLLWGASIKGGLAGFLVLMVASMLVAVGIGGLAGSVGIRTGLVESVQGIFPLIFILLFVSSAFFPTSLMSGVYGQIARYNPVTFMIDGLRYQVTVGFDAREAAIALGWALALAVLGIAVATRAIKGRLSR